MTKFVDSLGLKRLVTKIAEAVNNGTWLPVKKGDGRNSIVVGRGQATGETSYAEGQNTKAIGIGSHAEGFLTTARGSFSHTQGFNTTATGESSHAEGGGTQVSGTYSHAQGSSNYDDPSFIDMVGVGNSDSNKNASAIYVGRNSTGQVDPSNPKNGYQYLIGVGGYQGQDIAEGMKSVQEVIADLKKRSGSNRDYDC